MVSRPPESCRPLFLRLGMIRTDQFEYAAHDYQTINFLVESLIGAYSIIWN
jgi:hypothetical protein